MLLAGGRPSQFLAEFVEHDACSRDIDAEKCARGLEVTEAPRCEYFRRGRVAQVGVGRKPGRNNDRDLQVVAKARAFVQGVENLRIGNRCPREGRSLPWSSGSRPGP